MSDSGVNDLPVTRWSWSRQAVPFRASVPFPYIVIDDFLEEGYAREVASAFPSLEEAKTVGRVLNRVNERFKVQVCDLALFPKRLLDLHDVMTSDPLCAALAELATIPDLVSDPAMS